MHVVLVEPEIPQNTGNIARHSRTVYAVLMRMRLAAMTAELVTADLVERLQQAPLDAKAASVDARTPR